MRQAPQKKRMSATFLAFLVTALLVGIMLPQPTEARHPGCCVVFPPYSAGTQWNQIYQPNTGTSNGGQNTIQNLNSYPSSGLMTVYQISSVQSAPFGGSASAWAETKAGFTLNAGYFINGTYTFTYTFQISLGASLSSQCSARSGTSSASATIEFKGNVVDATTGSTLLYPDQITTVGTISALCNSGGATISNQIFTLPLTVSLLSTHRYLWVLYLDVQTSAYTPGLPASATIDVSTSPYGAYAASISWPG